MISVQLYLAFGYGDQAEVWGSSVELERVFKLGEKTQIILRDTSDEEFERVVTIDCEVAHIDYTDSGEPYIFIYHEDFISDEYSELLEAANWERMAEEDEDSILEVLEYAPPVAALHDLILVVGDYESVDADGYPNEVKVWHRVIEPDDPSVPVFGEKFHSHVVLSKAESDFNETPISNEEDPEPTEEQINKIHELLNTPEMLELKSKGEPTGLEPEIELLLGSETIDLESAGTPEDGYPVLAFYTAKVDYGEANVGVWCRSIDPYTELDMIADGWKLLPKEALNLDDFRLKERMELALNTFVTMVEDEKGTRFIERYEIIDPSLVTEEKFPLIPPALQEMSVGIQELDRDFENISSYIDDWSLEIREDDEDSK